MTDVFISYSRRDKEFVQRLSEKLKENSRDFWVDWEDIPPTVDWMKEIQRGIEAADAFAYVISPDSVRSDICTAELNHALENKKRLFPLLYREIETDEDREKLHPAISSHNWIYFREQDDFEKGFLTLLDALDTDFEHARAHTRLLIRAMEWGNKDRDNSFLLRGNDLSEAEAWLANAGGKKPEPTELHETYIAVSRRAATARRRLTYTITGFLALVSLLAVAIFVLFIQAETNRQIAVDARQTSDYNERQARSLALASNAQQILYRDNNPDLALALALAANNVGGEPPAQAQSVLAQAAFAPGTRLRLEGYVANNNDGGDIAISPDGTRALAQSFDGFLRYIDISDGSVIAQWESSAIGRIAFLPDGERALISYYDDGVMRLIDLATGGVLIEWEPETAYALAITPDGTMAVTGGYSSNFVVLWDLTNIQPDDAQPSAHEDRIVHVFEGQQDFINNIAVSGDGLYAVSGDSSGFALVWDLQRRELYTTIDIVDRQNNPDAGAIEIWDVAINSDATRILTGSEDWVVRDWVYDETVGSYVLAGHLIGHVNRVWQVAFLPDEDFVLSTSYDNNMILWDLEEKAIVRIFIGHTTAIYGLGVLPDGRRALTGSWDGTLRVWQLDNDAELRLFSGQHTDGLYNIALSPDGTRAVTVGLDNYATMWDVQTGEVLGRFEGHSSWIGDAAFSPDGSYLITGSADNTIILWDVASFTPIRIFTGHTATVRGVDFSPDGRTFASGASDNTVKLWDVESGRLIRTYEGHQVRVITVKFSPDGRRLLSTSSSSARSVILWDVESAQPLHVMDDHTGDVYDVAFNADGTQAVSAAGDNTIILWDLNTGAPLRTFSGHSGPVYAVTFSPDGNTIASGSRDATVRIWDVAVGAEVTRFDGHKDSVWSVVYSPDGRFLYSASADTTMREWQFFSLDSLMQRLFTNRYLMPLSCDQRRIYRIEPACNSLGTPPPATPYLTVTPAPSAAPLLQATATNVDAPQPSVTPTLTPEPAASESAVEETLEAAEGAENTETPE